MIEIININEIFKTNAPCLNLNFKCKGRKLNINIIGIKAGYALMLSIKFPLSNSIKARCIPQPKQSITKYCFQGQGSM